MTVRPTHWLCRLGLHAFPRYVTAHTQAPAPVRCRRCGMPYPSNAGGR